MRTKTSRKHLKALISLTRSHCLGLLVNNVTRNTTAVVICIVIHSSAQMIVHHLEIFTFSFFSPSVSLLANLPEDKLSKIVDCLEVVSYPVKLFLLLFITTVLHNPLAARGILSVADSCCQNIITIWPYTITVCQHVLPTSSQQDLTNYVVDEQSRHYSCHRWPLYIVTRII